MIVAGQHIPFHLVDITDGEQLDIGRFGIYFENIFHLFQFVGEGIIPSERVHGRFLPIVFTPGQRFVPVYFALDSETGIGYFLSVVRMVEHTGVEVVGICQFAYVVEGTGCLFKGGVVDIMFLFERFHV